MTRQPVQQLPPETSFQGELSFLAKWDQGARPAGWKLSPRAVVHFICGSGEPLELPAPDEELPRKLEIAQKFVGPRGLVERAVITLAGDRGLMLVGEPGTAKSMLSELLAAAVSGTSELTVQGSAGTNEDQLRYGWNYASLIAHGPTPESLVPSPVLKAMRNGMLVRIEEVTRCLPEVQDALVSILSERRLAIPELSGEHGMEYARPGFNVITTANLRDKGVNEMSAALKRRFNFEEIGHIREFDAELALVQRKVADAMKVRAMDLNLDESILQALLTVFRDLRLGETEEGWSVESPSSVMSTAEAVGVATSMALHSAYFPTKQDAVTTLPDHLLGVVLKDDPKNRGRLIGYWDGPIKKRAKDGAHLWRHLYDLRRIFEET